MTPSYTYDCPALDRLAQLAGATGDPDEGYPDGGADEPTAAQPRSVSGRWWPSWPSSPTPNG